MAGEGTGTSTRGTDLRSTEQRALNWRPVREQGVAEGKAAPPPAASPLALSSISTSDYVDVYKEVNYNPYDSPDGKNLSKALQVSYHDGTHITINIDQIGDELTVAIVRGEEFFSIGEGGRVFPKRMSRGTTPNLWKAKRRALIFMSEYFLNIFALSWIAIQFVFPGPSAGLPWRFRFGPRVGVKLPGPRPSMQEIEKAVESIRGKIGGPSVKEEIGPAFKGEVGLTLKESLGTAPVETQPKSGITSPQESAKPALPIPRGSLGNAEDEQLVAGYYWAQQGDKSKKTVASSEGKLTVSGPGYSKALGDFPQRAAPAGESESAFYVRRYEELSVSKPPPGRDYQIKGDEYASHAEVKDRIHQFTDGTNTPTGVSEDMCGNCRIWHQKAAKNQGQQIVVADPNYTRAFNPDGTVDIYTLDGTYVRTVPANVQPAAGARRSYKGVDW